MSVIKAFDFDGTLISGDSFPLFAFHALPPFRLMWGVVKSLPVVVRWKLGLLAASEAKEKIFFNLFKGMSYDRMEQKAKSFIAVLDGKLNDETIRCFKHGDEGELHIIVSASPGFWIRPWASSHGFDDVVATEAEVIDEKLTGRFSTPNCKGEEKVIRFLARYPARKEYFLHAWGDSKDDLPLLLLADSPHPVGRLCKKKLD